MVKDIKYYIDLRVKKLKLGAVEHLSVIFGKALSLVAFILLLGMALLLFTGALIILIAHLVGSLLWAFVIMGGVYLIAAVIFLLKRDTLFAGTMVGTFSGMFFASDDDETDDDYGKD